ncbi:MAG TPA: hypothetical protein VFB49_01810 [Patescibacteria group bacterium]|nr:hypothetical protein [Patescibacteria group bacterium]
MTPRAASVLLSTALLALSVPAAHAAAPGSVTLRYAMKPGAGYDQAASMALEMAVDPTGLPPAMSGLLQSMVGDMKQEINLKGRIDVGQKAGDGSLPIQYKVIEARAVLNHAGQIKEMPGVSSAASQPPTAGQISADGRQVTMESPAGSGQMPRALHDQITQALPTLPAGALSPGKAFDVIVPMTLFGGLSKGLEKANARWTYTLRSLAQDEALFDVQESLPENASMTMSSGQVIHLSGGGKGAATFNLKEGIFTSMKLDTSIQMTVVMSIPAGLAGGGTAGAGAAGDPGAPSSIEIKSSIQGPITMTLAPSAGR